MRKKLPGFDWALFIAVFAVSVFGIIIVSNLTQGLLVQQLINFFLGLAFFFILSRIDYRIYERFAPFIYAACLLFLLAPLVFGTLTRGAYRWIQIGPFPIQPSEIVKPFLVIFFAYYFSSKERFSGKEVLIGCLLAIVPIFLIFIQPDLGSSVVVALSWIGIVTGSGISLTLLVAGGVSFSLLAPLAWKFLLLDYQKQRVFTFLNPLNDPLGAGYNLIQATVAVGSGKLFGRGFGRGTQSHLRFLPERHTDFVFASMAEELGFIFSGLLIIGFVILLWRILVASQKTKDTFGGLICLGVFSLIFSQVFINISMNLGLLPITGITLPLVSYGGSSFVSTMIGLGIVESISRLKKKEEMIIIA